MVIVANTGQSYV